jgi:hypothetical protein
VRVDDAARNQMERKLLAVGAHNGVAGVAAAVPARNNVGFGCLLT